MCLSNSKTAASAAPPTVRALLYAPRGIALRKASGVAADERTAGDTSGAAPPPVSAAFAEAAVDGGKAAAFDTHRRPADVCAAPAGPTSAMLAAALAGGSELAAASVAPRTAASARRALAARHMATRRD